MDETLLTKSDQDNTFIINNDLFPDPFYLYLKQVWPQLNERTQQIWLGCSLLFHRMVSILQGLFCAIINDEGAQQPATFPLFFELLTNILNHKMLTKGILEAFCQFKDRRHGVLQTKTKVIITEILQHYNSSVSKKIINLIE